MARYTRQQLLKDVPVRRAVAAMALPTVISQIISIIYNLADIFFVGQIGDPDKVAAVSLVAPAFMITTALGNLFGIGGSSAISRALGKGNAELAKRTSTFCFYASIGAAALYSALLALFAKPFLRFYGASDATLPYAVEYTVWVLMVGAVPTVANVVLAHMLRADGKPRVASFGLSMGGILNMLLDPLFILAFGLGVTGVALATMLSNAAVLVFFLLYRTRCADSILDLSPADLSGSFRREVSGPVMASGIPAAVQTFVVSLFFMFLNRQARAYSDVHVAAMGIVQKLDNIPQYVSLGFAQGIIPLLGFAYAAGNYERMRSVSRFAVRVSVLFALLYVAVVEIFAPVLVRWFIPDSPATISLGTRFARIICVCTPLMAVCNIKNSTFQATGQARQALSICLFRKVYVGLPMLYLLDRLLPELGILIVTAVVDGIACFYVVYLERRFYRKLEGRELPGGSGASCDRG